jgi:hypothetical protein
LIQRIATAYRTGRIGMRFDGADLQKTEEDGWIFATNGKAHVAVRFLDSAYAWEDNGKNAVPTDYKGRTKDTGRILMHAGDISTHSFADFQKSVKENPLRVTPTLVAYRFDHGKQHLEAHLFDAHHPDTFQMPRMNGEILNLRPSTLNPIKTYSSPFLNADFMSDQISVTAGSVTRILDFSVPADASDLIQPNLTTGGHDE